MTNACPTTRFLGIADLGQLGDYRLVEKLGAGGMGVVYKAVHAELDRVVALKVLSAGLVDDEEVIARFKREIKAVGQLDHPHIVRALDARRIGETHFLVMEFIDGTDWEQLVRRLGPLRVADVCELGRQAALGLQHAHEHGLIHRDIKPSNLMLTRQGQAKILDLGLARMRGGAASQALTVSGQTMGTPDYIAPEQAADSHDVDIRADLYSLGCTLYKLLAGRAPFEDAAHGTLYSKLQAHKQESPPPITQFRRDLPRGLVAILGRLLAKEPGQRFATPGELAEVLAPLAAGSDLRLGCVLGNANGEIRRRSDGRRAGTQALASAADLAQSGRRAGRAAGGRIVSGPAIYAGNGNRGRTPAGAATGCGGESGSARFQAGSSSVGRPTLPASRVSGSSGPMAAIACGSRRIPTGSTSTRLFRRTAGGSPSFALGRWAAAARSGFVAPMARVPGNSWPARRPANGSSRLSGFPTHNSSTSATRRSIASREWSFGRWTWTRAARRACSGFGDVLPGRNAIVTDVSPDRRHLLVAAQRGVFWATADIYLLDRQDRSIRPLWQDSAGDHKDARPLWSPHTRTIAWHRNYTPGSLAKVIHYGVALARRGDGDSWNVEFQPDQQTFVTPLAWSPDGGQLLCALREANGAKTQLLLMDEQFQVTQELFQLDVSSWHPEDREFGNLADWAVVPAGCVAAGWRPVGRPFQAVPSAWKGRRTGRPIPAARPKE